MLMFWLAEYGKYCELRMKTFLISYSFFFSGQISGRTLGSSLRVPRHWTHSTGQVQALLQALGKYLLSSSVSAGEIRFLIIEDKISHFLTGYPSWINFWKLDTFCYEKILVVDLVSVGAHEKEEGGQRMQWMFIKQWLLPLDLENLSSFLTRGLSHLQGTN